MFLKNINLVNFRNHAKLNLDLDQTVVILGDNAQGKTNILEAIYFLATTKSSRVEKESQLIKEDSDFCTVWGIFDDDSKLEITLSQIPVEDQVKISKKTIVNGVPRRTLDYIGNLMVVSFSPEDINLVNGAPSLRRWHIDLSLAQTDRVYKKVLTEYGAIITSKNRILKKLKEGLGRLDELDFWIEKQLDLGKIIFEKRQQFFEFINTTKQKLGNFKYEYSPSLLTKERLDLYIDREIASCSSLIGPHRDDFSFKLSSKELASFGSRGEQRTAVLNLKLSELSFITDIQKNIPILLLDDVFSELDSSHREVIISTVSSQQTIISAVETENIPQEFLDSSKLVRVKNGQVIV